MQASDPGDFDSTRWTLIERVRGESDSDRRAALEELLRRYVPALRAHLVYRRRMQDQDAADLVQDFVANKILERDLVARADRNRGKFRGFLLTALDRFFVDWCRYNKAQKRAAPDTVSIDANTHDPAEGESPDVFDVAWGRTVLGQALQRMRDVCGEDVETQIWDTFRFRVLDPILTGSQPMEYQALVERCGFESPRQASNALITARRRFNRCLREVVAEYTNNDAEIDEEIQELQAIMSDEEAWSSELLPEQLQDTVGSGDVSDVEATQLAGLMSLNPVAESDWEPEELGQLLQHLLATPVAEVVTWSENLESYSNWSHRPLRQLFLDPNPPLALLEKTKRVGQVWAREGNTTMQPDVGAAIYFISIALALTRHGERITTSSNATLTAGFQRLIQSGWMDAQISVLLRDGIAKTLS